MSGPAPPALLVRPSRLSPGEIVGVATPSGSVSAPRRLARGLKALRGLGWEPRIGSCTPGGAPLDPQARADELNAFIRDPDVRAIVMTLGGYTTNGVLDLLDWDALREDPKVVVGYSDLTALLLAVVARVGCVAFHGPTLLPELAEFPAPLPYTAEHLVRGVGNPAALGCLQPPTAWTDELLVWDEADMRAREALPVEGWPWLRTGVATGPLLGGNLETLGVLVGTPYLPDLHGAVLFWETTSKSLALVERSLTHLEMAGVLDGIAGMVVGRSFRGGPDFETDLRQHVRQRFADAPFPVLAGVDLGHSDPMLTLPLGVRTRLDSAQDLLEVVDPGVR